MKVQVGKEFKMSLKVKNAKDYFESGAVIMWTADKLKYNGIESGDFLGESANFFPGNKQHFEQKDAVTFAYRLPEGFPAKTGDGVVCIVAFKALSVGTVTFEFRNGQVRDASLALVESKFDEFVFDLLGTENVNVHYFEIEIVQ